MMLVAATLAAHAASTFSSPQTGSSSLSQSAVSSARQHWAFQPVRKPKPPPDASGWSKNPIDQFINAKREEQKLRPMPRSDQRTLVRRVYFDLIGLPPTPAEVEAFLADQAPDALARLVDRLLASPRYGEKWGRHWMDVVRYADTAGDNADYPIPEARRYRDYLIDSFNTDKPYAQFVQEQIAGDILAKRGPRERYAEQVTATGFLALSRRYGTGPGELWHLVLEDSIETTGRAFLGLTLRCARCHDHKYDPITQQDYYALYGFFASTRYPWAGSEEVESKKFTRYDFPPLVPAAAAAPKVQAYEKQLQELRARIQQIEKNDPLVHSIAELTARFQSVSNQLRELKKEGRDRQSLLIQFAAVEKLLEDQKKELKDKLKALQTGLRGLEIPGLPTDLSGAYAVDDGQPLDACLQVRGEPTERGMVIQRGVPRVIAGGYEMKIPKGSSGRLQLAEWLTQPDHPLTARVLVNRVWQHHFGKGIVTTPSNFGLRGEPPTHPELLDWLTGYFLDHGGSIKALHRLILQSGTYQLASTDHPANAEKDPANRWYWRFDRQRLEAEQIRDAILAVSGSLDCRRPPDHPFPPFQDWHWTQHNPFKTNYSTLSRSVYLMTQRFQRHPYIGLFDGPDPNASTDVRPNSTVPAQALFMMNNPFVQEQARALARRLIDAAEKETGRIELACALAWSRKPSDAEIQKALSYLKQFRAELDRLGVAKASLELEAWTSYAKILLTANEFIYLD